MTVTKFNILDHLDGLTVVKETETEYHCECPLCGDGGFKIDKKTGKYSSFKCNCNNTPEGKKAIIEKISPKKSVRPKQVQEWVHKDWDDPSSPQVKVVRLDDGRGKKRVWQEHWDEEQKKWVSGLKGVNRKDVAPYCCSETCFLLFARLNFPLFIVEGQPCVDTLVKKVPGGGSVYAVTNLGGAGKWEDSDSEFLAKKTTEYGGSLSGQIVLCPDRDKPGLNHTIAVARSLQAYGFTNICWFFPYGELSYLPENLPESNGVDIVDWLEKNRAVTAQDIINGIVTTPEWLNKLLYEEQPESQTRRKNFYQPASEWFAKNDKPISWIVPGLIVEGSNMIAAQSNCGKSILVSSLAVALAQGSDWLGYELTQRKVLYHCSDERETILRSRLKKQGLSEHCDFFIPYIKDSDNEYWSAKHLDALEEAFKELKPDVFIVDSVRSAIAQPTGTKETSEDVGGVIKDIINLCDRHSVTVIFIHHDKKDKEATGLSKVSGHTSLVTPLDVVIRMERVSSDRNNPKRKLIQEKNRCGEQLQLGLSLDADTLTYRVTEFGEGEGEDSSEEGKESVKDRVLGYLWKLVDTGDRSHHTAKEIGDAIKASERRVKDCLKVLEEEKKVESRQLSGGKTIYYRYCG